MDVEDFIKSTLEQITNSVTNNHSVNNVTYCVNSEDGVVFDLAVTTANEEKSDAGAGGGIRMKVISAEGNIGSSKTDSVQKDSRIRFKVDVVKKVAGPNSTTDSYFEERYNS